MFEKKNNGRQGRKYRDIGIYTTIPTMMIVGPVLGYILGYLAEKEWGHAPWPTTGGALFGFIAAARQVYLILKRISNRQ